MPKKLTASQIVRFRKRIYAHFKKHGRTLPWRVPVLKVRKDGSVDAYKVMVSEVMLQQTQVDRVVPHFQSFVRTFPTVRSLENASTAEVLRAWQGLGYNRRALNLKKAAEVVVSKYDGRVPSTIEELESLPGIGPYTAAAISIFAFNNPIVCIETNIRSVFLHAFFLRRTRVTDEELMPLIAQTLDRNRPRRWYSALMDYGSSLKKRVGNPSRRSAHHVLPTRFEGSIRQLRGSVLRFVSVKSRTMRELITMHEKEDSSIASTVRALVNEGFLEKIGGRYRLIKT